MTHSSVEKASVLDKDISASKREYHKFKFQGNKKVDVHMPHGTETHFPSVNDKDMAKLLVEQMFATIPYFE
ncbi:hypothetical protein [Solemya elarraichensis gill symbiont]|uniref:Uncharacterized protein n=1 Tax=Solemya elarraichensis gill symbiont TaxID=1918949 RepID=A0A1T2KUU4_9GAMM|nr:hypothetical protein [Solemya elarraichensis gill symbiont]OOZ36571.1 hypothetical protein BOW52_10695 [Solemya elarraichensis gill symbiont]